MHGMGGTLRVQAHRVCVVYDGDSGSIVHVHHDIALPGGRPASENEVEDAAMAQVQKRGRHTPRLRLLHVNAEELETRAKYKIDPVREVVVRVE
jgi:hypothetical protein